MVTTLRGRLDRGDQEVRAHAAGDEHLGAVDAVAAVTRARAGADAGDVGAGVGLGDASAAIFSPRIAGHQLALLLLLGAELPDRRQGDRRCARRCPRRAPPEPQRASSSASTAAATSSPPPRRTAGGTSVRGTRAARSRRRPRWGTSAPSSHSAACGRSSAAMNSRHLGPQALVLGREGRDGCRRGGAIGRRDGHQPAFGRRSSASGRPLHRPRRQAARCRTSCRARRRS